MSFIKKPVMIQAKWSAPTNICACTTTINLGSLAFQQNASLLCNRQTLQKELSLTTQPLWIHQVHSNVVMNVDNIESKNILKADGSYTQSANQICSIITADCLPILLCSLDGHELAALHAGWRGLLSGIVEAGIEMFQSPSHQLLAWLGPAISAQFFIVGDDVYDKFLLKDKHFKDAFQKITTKHFHCDLYKLARQHLQALGVRQIYCDNYCTYKDKTLFYSYRRQSEKAGRMATLIWRRH